MMTSEGGILIFESDIMSSEGVVMKSEGDMFGRHSWCVILTLEAEGNILRAAP